jgi:hypothetical protein
MADMQFQRSDFRVLSNSIRLFPNAVASTIHHHPHTPFALLQLCNLLTLNKFVFLHRTFTGLRWFPMAVATIDPLGSTFDQSVFGGNLGDSFGNLSNVVL